MSTDLIQIQTNCRELGHLSRIAEQAAEFIANSKAANTVLAYKRDWKDFTGWCQVHSLVSLPASFDTVALYLSDLAATHKTSTIIRRCSAISQAHQIGEFETPTKS